MIVDNNLKIHIEYTYNKIDKSKFNMQIKEKLFQNQQNNYFSN